MKAFTLAVVLSLLFLIGFAGFGAEAVSKPEQNKDAVQADLDKEKLRAAQEDNIREAVFRFQFKKYGSLYRKTVKTYFLALTETLTMEDDEPAEGEPIGYVPKTIIMFGDPSDEFMSRFRGNKPPVRKASEQMLNDMTQMLFTVGEIEWLNKNEVLVNGGYSLSDGLVFARYTYHLVRGKRNWKVTKATKR